ncbi:MAG TPA: porin [Accumulibacter sp.]|uniref:porin n=1 Tax=Accumulibacter sp. TaxID=2053492 RepID=UPI002BF81FFC|nr:porin [Accumulibacter sp.]HRF72749.1 porin [Accumulibacter sp.]
MGNYPAQTDKNIGNLDNARWSLGAVVPVLASSQIRFGYGQTDWDQDHKVPTMLNGSTRAYTLGWTTDMSKRTTLYAGYIYVDNDRDSCGVGPISGNGALPFTCRRAQFATDIDRATHAEAVAVAKST